MRRISEKMSDQELKLESGAKLCQDMTELDGTIIFAAIGSRSGKELASAAKPSTNLFAGIDRKLRSEYSSLVALVIDANKHAEGSLGNVNRIVTTFQKLKTIVIPYYEKGIYVIVLTTRDCEENRIAFQILQLLNNRLGV
jgi:hypothetical protein